MLITARKRLNENSEALHKIDTLSERIKDVEKNVNKIEVKSNQLDIDQQRSQNKRIAFAASLHRVVTVPDAVLPYNTKLVDEGAAYDFPNATFNAPTRGLYWFSWTTLMKERAGCSYLALDGTQVDGFASYGHHVWRWDSVSQDAVLVLDAGQKVTIRLGKNETCGVTWTTSDWGVVSTFKGALLNSNLE